MTDNTKISRRTFIGIAGTAIGAAAFAANSAPPIGAPPKPNKPSVDHKSFTEETLETDVLVIGSGIAGLFAAVKAHDAGAKVMMVSKGRLGTSGLTPFGKGVFSYNKDTAKMTPETFMAKVADSAMGTNNPVFTKQLLDHSADRVADLTEWGFFDSPLCNESFSKPMKEREIPLFERIMVTHLHKENGRIAGASGFSMDENKIFNFSAKTVVLCTGSGGFKPNGFPMCDLTHDGTIMAYSIGAKVTGKEWNDGHPASAENSASCYDNWHGQVEEKPSLTSAEIHHDLGVDLNYQAYINGGPVSMGPPGADLKSNSKQTTSGPFVPEAFRSRGERPERPPQKAGWLAWFSNDKREGPPNMGGESVGGSTAGMAIHKSEGLVPVDETGLSTIPGLWAAGDALGSYMSGGIYTQVGSSMAGSAVQGTIAGVAAAKASKAVPSVSNLSAKTLKQTKDEILAPLKRENGYSPAWVTQIMQSVMIPNFVLYIKKERMMNAALAYIEELKEHHGPMLIASDRHHLRLAHETMNMLITAEMKLKASMMRTESRCSHYRLDYPDVDNENWQAWINIYQDDKGEMQFEKQPFGEWPKKA
jgi:succinate dehydrogenase/fumarate reductase flavoprotein subunit